MLKTVIFDVDGTLLNTERIYMRAWVEAGAQFGYKVTDEVLLQTRAVDVSAAKVCFRRYCGEDFPYDAVRAERVRIAEEIIEKAPAHTLWMPYAREILQWLTDQGLTLAAASSTVYEKTCAHLKHAGLLDFFQVIICGDMVEKGKPAPDIFLKAAEQAEAELFQCIVVGDTPADVFAGSAAGIKVVLIPDQVPANEQTTPLSWKILPSLEQLKDAVAEFNGEQRS